MSPINNTVLAVLFVGLAFASTFLMYYLWGFPYNEELKKSSAPRGLTRLHRLLGYAFLIIYVAMMLQMVPRLWNYQVELPARTVAHLLLGMAIGIILLVKIVIVRFYKHLESKLVPGLGTGLLICTVLLIGLAVPVSVRETLLLRQAREDGTFSAERLERVRTLLPVAGLEDSTLIAELASEDGLIHGRSVLRAKCTQCHDLRTILARPRTPENWRQTVTRMAERSVVLNAIDEKEQWEVTAYLIAVTPTLQSTARLRRQQMEQTKESMDAMMAVMTDGAGLDDPFDAAVARAVFESRCSQCHGLDWVERNPPRSGAEALTLVERMVQNGLSASEEELAQIVRYLTETYDGGSDSGGVGGATGAPLPPTDPEALLAFLNAGEYRAWSREPAPHPSAGPHPVTVQVYTNAALASSLAAGASVHPTGAAAVKELFGPDGELSGWAAIVKTDADSDGGNGWYFYELTSMAEGAAPVAAGSGVPLCAGCHATGRDFYLSN